MGYEDILRDGVVIIDSELDSMKLDVTHAVWTGDDTKGNDSWDTPVLHRVLVSRKRRTLYTPNGTLIHVLATLQFTDAISVHPKDIFTLPDGSTAPIVETGGFVDVGTDEPFATKVVLGNAVGS